MSKMSKLDIIKQEIAATNKKLLRNHKKKTSKPESFSITGYVPYKPELSEIDDHFSISNLENISITNHSLIKVKVTVEIL